MIVVQIHSGLGNQLFMYAAARALAHKLNTSLFLDVDSDCRQGIDLGRYVGHTFQLDRYRIRASVPGLADDCGEAKGSPLAVYSTLKNRLRDIGMVRQAAGALRRRGIDPAGLLLKLSGKQKLLFREERGDWGYKPQFMELPDNTILRGCFFSFRYFDPIRSLILDELSLKEPLSDKSREIEARIRSCESVSLHVRRGDIVTNPEYRSWYEGILTDQYYRNAARFFLDRLQQPEFFIFSDDIEWAKHHLKLPGRTTYVDHNTADRGYEDLHLMSCCRHNVTAGFSSFSWWGAYLNRNPDKIVVRTRRMNALDSLNHPEDFFLPDWKVIDS